MGHAFDPELRPWISLLPVLDLRDLPAARTLLDSVNKAAPFVLPEGISMEARSVPGPPGAPDVRVLVFSPHGGTSRPALVYMHGGGFVLGDADGDRELPAQLAAEVGAVVVSVDYRLAPEHPFPAAIEDCYAVVRWVAGYAAELDVDPARIGIGGVSAGGGLAVGTALVARDRGGPALCFQMLDIPELDDRLQTPSMRQFVDTPLWNLSNAEESWRRYLGAQAGGDAVSPYAAPARAHDLSGLPAAYVSVCQFDPLRDEGIAYAQRLVQHGVPTELHLHPRAFHGSGGLIPTAAISCRMRAELVDATRRGLATVHSSCR
ncbi:alpha/beta hydrolase fold domain-containing protein [Amycolatopsis sp. RM579]|uniref:Alpha/beta hydrolase fold domain-containing protein n=1 Tax=Amycolatopsis pithecellobii TaxID=664692 RepID=A0A6N7YMY1_9PSEU|nr:alpha/beta hydrolase fold domain-containing protein [Amycolatopsis pithecellobii]